jgi:glycosyltransferase involved in cell wall biosynthesis
MAAGRPVLATGGSGFAEILRDGATGFLVPPGDCEALAGALARLSADRAALRAVGERARADLRRFAAPRVVTELCDHYAAAVTASASWPR